MFTPKQIEVLKSSQRDDWFIRICHGAVRSGKTFVDNVDFLMELKRVKEIASQEGNERPMYILAGVSSGTIQNNVLQELTNVFGIEPHFDRHGAFELMGVRVVTTFTGSIGGLGAIRGMKSYGAYINEASLAKEQVFDEIKNRCSAPSARIICDTNPDNPQHWLKRDYIDPPDNDVIDIHFAIEDNTFLDHKQVERYKKSTPSGMFYDRAILGLWVSGDGVVYRDFDERKMVIEHNKLPDDLIYVAGVDWGYEHKGSIVVFGIDADNNWYLVEETTRQYREIDYWLRIAKEFQTKYGQRMPFYCDSARPEHVAAFSEHGINAINGYKSRLTGVENVASLMKTNHFFVDKIAINNQNRNRGKSGYHYFLDEIYQYVWNEQTGEPIKQNDDVMDAMRYAIASHLRMQKINKSSDHNQQAAILRNLGI